MKKADSALKAGRSAGVSKISLTMYPFRISTDEHIPQKFLLKKKTE